MSTSHIYYWYIKIKRGGRPCVVRNPKKTADTDRKQRDSTGDIKYRKYLNIMTKSIQDTPVLDTPFTVRYNGELIHTITDEFWVSYITLYLLKQK